MREEEKKIRNKKEEKGRARIGEGTEDDTSGHKVSLVTTATDKRARQ